MFDSGAGDDGARCASGVPAVIVTFTAQRRGGPFDEMPATVATLLVQWGYAVLLVDWNPSVGPTAERGLADLLAHRLAPREVIVPLTVVGGDVVDTVPAGDWTLLPDGFDAWASAYSQGLADFVEECAEEWRAMYEVVVVRDGAQDHPSRGIAVAHVPDALVVASDDAAAVRVAAEGRDRLPYGRGQLLVLPMGGAVDAFERWTHTWVHATVQPEQVVEIASADMRALTALLASEFAGTDQLVADINGYTFAAEHRNGRSMPTRSAARDLTITPVPVVADHNGEDPTPEVAIDGPGRDRMGAKDSRQELVGESFAPLRDMLSPSALTVLERYRALELDTTNAPRMTTGERPGSTLYRADALLLPLRFVRDAPLLSRLNEVLDPIGVFLEPVVPETTHWRKLMPRLNADLPVTALLRLQEDSTLDDLPDPWAVLLRLRRKIGEENVAGIGLEHLVHAAHAGVPGRLSAIGKIGGVGSEPGVQASGAFPVGHGVPLGSGPAVGTQSATHIRTPVRLFQTRPRRRRGVDLMAGRRPVVAVLDTGIGTHPWLPVGSNTEDSTVVEVAWNFQQILADAESALTIASAHSSGSSLASPAEPIQHWADPINSYSGHGTFASGLIHQTCPDARILSLRVMHADGITTDRILLLALEWLRLRVVAALEEGKPEELVDIVSMSLGFYPEFHDAQTAYLLSGAVRRLTELGVTVVAAAGNDATARPFLPAAQEPDSGTANPLLIAVGALNASGRTIAAFSNEGDWVTHWAPGNALVSTIPLSQDPRVAERSSHSGASAFPADPTIGFASWFGTSFATPVVAGMIANELTAAPDPSDSTHRPARAATALAAVNTHLRDLGWRREREEHE
ncbi:S8 family serine peptidase [Actinokineospora sp. 24-640]